MKCTIYHKNESEEMCLKWKLNFVFELFFILFLVYELLSKEGDGMVERVLCI